LFFFRADRPLHAIRIGGRRELLGGDLYRFAVERRETIETELAAHRFSHPILYLFSPDSELTWLGRSVTLNYKLDFSQRTITPNLNNDLAKANSELYLTIKIVNNLYAFQFCHIFFQAT